MQEILKTIGIDVHKDSYSICVFNTENSIVEKEIVVNADSNNVEKSLKKLESEARKAKRKETYLIGYEAGPTGFGLKRKLEAHGYNCKVMAPTTIYSEAGGRKVKTDRLDARNIARALYWGSFKEVYPLSCEDEAYRDFIRMRDDRCLALKKAKQNLLSFLLRRDVKYDSDYWTKKHLVWLEKVRFANKVDQYTFTEYLREVNRLRQAIEELDAAIEEFSHVERYEDKVKRLKCFAGIDTHVAMSVVTEIGDFSRFRSASEFSSYIGLCPGEHSSGKTHGARGITKAGNAHLRRLLCESANSMKRCNLYRKSERLLARQKGVESKYVDYADRGSQRMKKKFYSLASRGKDRNKIKAAVAREMACFIWGMMTDHLDQRSSVA